MKTERIDIFEDVTVKIVEYTPGRRTERMVNYGGRSILMTKQELLPDAEETFAACMAHMDEVQQRDLQRRTWTDPNKPLKEALERYGPSDVVGIYLADNYFSWEGGRILRSSVCDGGQATALIENYLNTYGFMSSATPFIPIDRIPVSVGESMEPTRMLGLHVGINVPARWRERWQITVEEKSTS